MGVGGGSSWPIYLINIEKDSHSPPFTGAFKRAPYAWPIYCSGALKCYSTVVLLLQYNRTAVPVLCTILLTCYSTVLTVLLSIIVALIGTVAAVLSLHWALV